jgi:hypothetical protein
MNWTTELKKIVNPHQNGKKYTRKNMFKYTDKYSDFNIAQLSKMAKISVMKFQMQGPFFTNKILTSKQFLLLT